MWKATEGADGVVVARFAYRAKQSPEAAPALRDYLSRPLEERRAWFEP